jgi:hypothetical protein
MAGVIDSLKDDRLSVPFTAGTIAITVPPEDDKSIAGDKFFGQIALINLKLEGNAGYTTPILAYVWIYDFVNGWTIDPVALTLDPAKGYAQTFQKNIYGQTWGLQIPIIPANYSISASLASVPQGS